MCNISVWTCLTSSSETCYILMSLWIKSLEQLSLVMFIDYASLSDSHLWVTSFTATSQMKASVEGSSFGTARLYYFKQKKLFCQVPVLPPNSGLCMVSLRLF